MNKRFTLGLLMVLTLLGVYVFLFEFQRPKPAVYRNPFFYNVPMEEIIAVEISYHGATQRFLWNAEEKRWVFGDGDGAPVLMDRWGGIPLLLGGPRVSRQLQVKAQKLAVYGLDPPVATIRVGLKQNQNLVIFLGNQTPDGLNHYATKIGSSQVVLIDRSWGDILMRLVTEPPYSPKPN